MIISPSRPGVFFSRLMRSPFFFNSILFRLIGAGGIRGGLFGEFGVEDVGVGLVTGLGAGSSLTSIPKLPHNAFSPPEKPDPTALSFHSVPYLYNSPITIAVSTEN